MITSRNLAYSYGSRSPVFEDLTFDLPKGAFGIVEAVGGAGKSTLVKLLSGILAPSKGELVVNGHQRHARRDVLGLRRSIGLVAEEVELITDRTVSENIVLPLELAGVHSKSARGQLHETLHRFGLDNVRHEFPDALSQGERQRAKLARALISAPLLLILDDPTLGLDPTTASALWDLLFREHQRGMTVLATVTAIPSEPRFSVCHRIALG